MLMIALLISAAAPATTASTNPLALAKKGMLQCYQPDVVKKTCDSIASYQRTGPGTYDNKAIVSLGSGATLETHSPVTVRGGAVCGLIKAEDVMAGRLRIGDRVITGEQAKPILEHVVQAFAPFAGKEICTRYEPAGADFKAKATIAGASLPERDITVKWIEPTEGYTAAR